MYANDTLLTSQVRRELLHKATVSIAELSMTLHDANEATEKANEQVRLEKQRATELENELKQVQQCTGIGPAARLDKQCVHRTP